MRFVDGEEGDLQPVEQREGALAHQPFRRDVEQVERSRAGVAFNGADFVEGEGRVQIRGPNARLPQGAHLVAHQGDQGRDDDRDAVAQQGGDLVAQRLAAAGGHDHQTVSAAGEVVDDRFLLTSKRVVSEDAIEHLARRSMHGDGFDFRWSVGEAAKMGASTL